MNVPVSLRLMAVIVMQFTGWNRRQWKHWSEWLIDWLIDWLNCGFTSHSTQNRSFQRRSSDPISWLSTEKLKQPGLVASYDLRPGNGEGIFWFWRFINLSVTYLYTYPLTVPGPTQGLKLMRFSVSALTAKSTSLLQLPKCVLSNRISVTLTFGVCADKSRMLM